MIPSRESFITVIDSRAANRTSPGKREKPRPGEDYLGAKTNTGGTQSHACHIRKGLTRKWGMGTGERGWCRRVGEERGKRR